MVQRATAVVELAQGPTLGGGEHEAVTARTWDGARQGCASWLPGLPASRITTTSRVVMTAARGRVERGGIDLGAANSAVLAQTSEPGLLEGLVGLDWGVDRRDLADRVGHRLFHVPAPPDDQLALSLVLGDRGRDHVER